MNTAALGQLAVVQKLKSLGACNVVVQKEGNKPFITFIAPNGKTHKVMTRAKTAGTLQTSTRYTPNANVASLPAKR